MNKVNAALLSNWGRVVQGPSWHGWGGGVASGGMAVHDWPSHLWCGPRLVLCAGCPCMAVHAIELCATCGPMWGGLGVGGGEALLWQGFAA